MRTDKKHPSKRSGLVLLALTLALLAILGELVLRLWPKPAAGGLAGLHRASTVPGLNWELTPGYSSEKYTVNAAGFRGPACAVQKPDSLFRIAVIGDSHTFGLGVYDENLIYPARLRARLADSFAVEVCNFGVPGYNTWQEFAQLRQVVMPYQPDLVVLGFVFNDADETTVMLTGDGPQQTGAAHNTAPQTTSLTGLLKKSHLVLALKNAVETIGLALFDYYPDYMDMKITSARWREMQQTLLRMHAFLRERDIPLVVMVFPVTYQLRRPETESRAQNDMLTFLRSNDIPLVNLFPAFRAFLQQHGFDYHRLIVRGIRDTHPTAAGHAIVARELAEQLIEFIPHRYRRVQKP